MWGSEYYFKHFNSPIRAHEMDSQSGDSNRGGYAICKNYEKHNHVVYKVTSRHELPYNE